MMVAKIKGKKNITSYGSNRYSQEVLITANSQFQISGKGNPSRVIRFVNNDSDRRP